MEEFIFIKDLDPLS